MSAVRNFIITLILSLLIFGLIAYGIVQFALGAFGLDGKGDESQGTDSITVEPDGSVTDSPDDPKTWDDVKGDSFTVLLIGTDHQPSVYKDYGKSEGTDENGFPKDPRTVGADTMILVRVNKETGECVICAIPTNTKITADGMQCRLSELYAMKGAEAVKRRVMALTGLPVDYYAAISVENFAKLINGLGGVTFFVAKIANTLCDETGAKKLSLLSCHNVSKEDLENDISYVDNTGKTVNLRRGSQKLNGEKAVSMLKYRGYGDGDHRHCGRSQRPAAPCGTPPLHLAAHRFVGVDPRVEPAHHGVAALAELFGRKGFVGAPDRGDLEIEGAVLLPFFEPCVKPPLFGLGRFVIQVLV
mgnify:CR=1 FL=1